jgi:hypothetical protein
VRKEAAQIMVDGKQKKTKKKRTGAKYTFERHSLAIHFLQSGPTFHSPFNHESVNGLIHWLGQPCHDPITSEKPYFLTLHWGPKRNTWAFWGSTWSLNLHSNYMRSYDIIRKGDFLVFLCNAHLTLNPWRQLDSLRAVLEIQGH